MVVRMGGSEEMKWKKRRLEGSKSSRIVVRSGGTAWRRSFAACVMVAYSGCGGRAVGTFQLASASAVPSFELCTSSYSTHPILPNCNTRALELELPPIISTAYA
jgi:hypothetical protein